VTYGLNLIKRLQEAVAGVVRVDFDAIVSLINRLREPRRRMTVTLALLSVLFVTSLTDRC